MIISSKILDELKNSSTDSRVKKANEIASSGKVAITKCNYENPEEFSIHSVVDGNHGNYNTYIEVQNGEISNVTCTCPDYESTYGTCKHILATAIDFAKKTPQFLQGFNEENKYEETIFKSNTQAKNKNNKADEKYRIYRQMISSFYEEEQNTEQIKLKAIGDVRLEAKVIYNYNSKNIKVEFKIGNKQMYKIKNIPDFYDRMQNNENYKYGLKLEFIHSREAFEKESIRLLDFAMKYGEIIKYANESADKYYTSLLNNSYITLSNSGMDDFFNVIKGNSIEFETEYTTERVQFVDNEPEINFKIKSNDKQDYILTTDTDIFEYSVIRGKNYIYFIQKNKLYKCSKEFEKTVLKLLNIFKVNFTKEIPFKKDEFADFYSLIVPEMKHRISMQDIDQEELQLYMPKELKVKVFLDYDKSNFVTADIKFKYNDLEFCPFIEIKEKIPRNAIEESKALDMFKNSGFMYDANNNKLILANEEKIYEFLKTGIEQYIEKFDVLATEEFKKRQIVTPKISSVGVKIENNLLNIDLSGIDFEKSELEEIMKKYKMKKKFHRLKNGEFVDLENNTSLETIEKIVEASNLDFKELESKNIKLPVYRSLYLDKILKQNDIVVKQGETYKDLIDDVYNRQISDKYILPKKLKADLREYQQVGFDWLETLDEYRLGGILADDMGLGKTIQVLAVIMAYLENTKESERKPILVVCPSSLSLNWKEEAQKFTPTIKTEVISGSSEERANLIDKIRDYDIAITSYDLLKRDIDIYKQKNYTFRFIIADEAQYIKNNNTKNARVIKEINATTRYALTGTPIENSLSELWSIFDFIMPGYLFSYNKFKIQYETPIVKDQDQSAMSKLKAMIEPFVLRRVKEKVLTELPEKTITVLNNEMADEQLKIYLSFMQKAKKEAKEEIEENGIANSQIKILALLMRLRQICCHPGLFIDNYEGESSKLNQCMEIIKDAVDGGHKILLFSGYSSMFWYIEEELKKQNIKYFKLTGQTKVEDRMDLVNKFNKEDDIKVFLISLKAGGTGLNLIGADMVIHYDPWWNLSAENQATDRTYRIGQKRNVQVYKLITKNSIEEKIYNLQEKKAKLADDMLSTKETFINKLSKDEIMNLFE